MIYQIEFVICTDYKIWQDYILIQCFLFKLYAFILLTSTRVPGFMRTCHMCEICNFHALPLIFHILILLTRFNTHPILIGRSRAIISLVGATTNSCSSIIVSFIIVAPLCRSSDEKLFIKRSGMVASFRLYRHTSEHC